MDLEREERIIFSGIYCGDRISSVARSRRVTQRGRLNRRTRERAIKRRVGARRIKRARDHCQQCHLAVIQLREEVKGCVLTRLRDFVDAVEKGSAFAAVRKRAPLEKQRGKERKGVDETRTREGGDGLKSSGQPGFDRSIFIPWPDESTREQQLQTRARIDPSFLCVLARGTVRSRHCSTRRRRTRSAEGAAEPAEKRIRALVRSW